MSATLSRRSYLLLTFSILINLALALPADATVVSRNVLRSYFVTGDIPTESQFVDLIDSQVDLTFTFGSFAAGHTIDATAGGIRAIVGNQGWSIGHLQDPASESDGGYSATVNVGAGSEWPGESGFLGFHFEIIDPVFGPGTHYGFLQMSVDGPGAATPHAIHISGVAYESTPDTSITTFSIPEPSSAVLLCLGVAIALLHRRRCRF